MKNGEKTFFLFLMLGLFFGIVRSKSVDEKKERHRERERGIFKKEGYLFYIRALNKVENSFVKFEN